MRISKVNHYICIFGLLDCLLQINLFLLVFTFVHHNRWSSKCKMASSSTTLLCWLYLLSQRISPILLEPCASYCLTSTLAIPLNCATQPFPTRSPLRLSRAPQTPQANTHLLIKSCRDCLLSSRSKCLRCALRLIKPGYVCTPNLVALRRV